VLFLEHKFLYRRIKGEVPEDNSIVPIVRNTSLHTPVPFSPPLEHYFLPQVEDVVREVRKLKAY
jgi:pyruvate/2-oxoglutarate/acetoin dehydrogenase E1 component